MTQTVRQPIEHTGPVLVLGGTGKTGRRIVSRLKRRGIETRIGSRSASPAFDWQDPDGWDATLKGAHSVYISYTPDLAVPAAKEAILELVHRAKAHGVKHLVLLSGRGEPDAQACERIVQESGIDWTIVRASWFNQNFSEGEFLQLVLSGNITLPVGHVREPFIDADDIADVAVAALTETGHAGEVYEVTGPRLMTFEDVARDIANASGRPVKFVRIPSEDFLQGLRQAGAPDDQIWLLDYLFTNVLDGRNAHLTDGVQRALGRPPKDFSEFAREMAATGLWRNAA
ncbi:MAG: NmrA family transcriptional regulator [Hyphomonas sp.]|uniref:NAD(P)H-binding protein n=1 Tax=unclassified Hyphomonas TaxID=2630699 RepID=UPI000B6919C3|nr:NAD(P)H-binding protein [Hyphomonas sp.]MAH92842.1 NmrA family transcriptional regulator [Hyphomonas sp.]OUX87205.1 MAG: NmrA family transcriptional regulator [Hyphomonas sp. TMED31]HBF91009.1 NmrA family transcriptional regulator [Hyphomonas atlantica]